MSPWVERRNHGKIFISVSLFDCHYGAIGLHVCAASPKVFSGHKRHQTSAPYHLEELPWREIRLQMHLGIHRGWRRSCQ